MNSKSYSCILIQNGVVISMDPTLGILYNCDILIERDEIVKVEPNIVLKDPSTTRIVDAKNCLVSPGFIDGHHHMWQQLLRSVATDWSLADYVTTMRMCYGSLYTAEDVYVANYAAAMDLLDNGVTTVVDHCHILNSPEHTDAAINALKTSGIRGAFCYGFYPNPRLTGDGSEVQTVDTSFDAQARREDATRVRREHFPDNTWEASLLTFGIATNEPDAIPMSQLRDEIAFARSLDATIITAHAGLGHYDMGKQVVQNLGDSQTLGRDLLFSHGAAFTDDECKLLAAKGCGIVVTPETELQMGMGHPIAFRAEEHACNVGLGLDITSNQNNDMQTQMRLLLQAQRAHDNSQLGKPPISIRRKTTEVLHMATQGGADALGIGHLVGSLTPGKLADIVLTSCEDINMVPMIDPIGMLVCNAQRSNIRSVIVNGRFLKDEGELCGVDWSELKVRIREHAKRLTDAGSIIRSRLYRAASAEDMVSLIGHGEPKGSVGCQTR